MSAERPAAGDRRGFSPVALFLLELSYENLFEPANAAELGDHLTYRCKGCQALLGRRDRLHHYKHHKRVEGARREREIRLARESALAKARQARGRRAA